MTDPLRTPDGHVFERAALDDWLKVFTTDPVSGSPLSIRKARSYCWGLYCLLIQRSFE